MRLTPVRRSLVTFSLALTAALGIAYVVPSAQAPPAPAAGKKVLTVDDYTKWKSITGQEISSDGKWVTYVLQTTNVPQAEAKPVLHLLNLDTNQDVAVADATGGRFSSDAKWIAYQVEPGRGRGGRG
ncbi:MAG TPA: hypothetical protein VFO19_14215, partial [Vicinamibacterales bacterium]|nr:hypothetical protein [Vicinamibacterales bacterium]